MVAVTIILGCRTGPGDPGQSPAPVSGNDISATFMS
jgi:hypothetical protein